MKATVANTIRFGCSAFHSIFPNRAAVLNHLFCVNGNGYQWIKGQLVNVCDPIRQHTPLDKLVQIKFDEDRKRNAEMRKDMLRYRKDRAKRLAAGDPKEKAIEKSLKDMVDKIVEGSKTKHASMTKEAIEAERAAYNAEHKSIQKQIRYENRYRYKIPRDIEKRIVCTDYNNWYPMSPNYFKMYEFPDDIQPDWLAAIVETCLLIIKQPNKVSRDVSQKTVDQNQKMANMVLQSAMDHVFEKTGSSSLVEIQKLATLTKWPL